MAGRPLLLAGGHGPCAAAAVSIADGVGGSGEGVFAVKPEPCRQKQTQPPRRPSKPQAPSARLPPSSSSGRLSACGLKRCPRGIWLSSHAPAGLGQLRGAGASPPFPANTRQTPGTRPWATTDRKLSGSQSPRSPEARWRGSPGHASCRSSPVATPSPRQGPSLRTWPLSPGTSLMPRWGRHSPAFTSLTCACTRLKL